MAVLLALALLLAGGFPLFCVPANAVSQAELDALKRQRDQLSQQKDDIEAQLDALNGQVTSQTEKLSLLNEQLDVTSSEIDLLSEQLALYTNSIAQMENELTLDREKEQDLLEKYKAHVRSMEENGYYSYIEILLGASSIEDLLCRIDTIKEIMEYFDGLVDDVREAQEAVTTAKANMEAEMAAQQEVFAAYQEKQAELLDQQAEAQAVLSDLAADSADYQDQLDSVSALQSSIDGQISNMADALAEMERIKAEQAAAQQAAQQGGGSGSGGSGSGGIWYGDSEGTGTGQDIVDLAETFLGVPYVYGGTSPSGFDCSGLVYYCYKNFGYTVNRTAAGLAYSGTAVSATELQPGDIILFTSSGGSYIGHTGIYVGNGQFIHAPHTGDVVKISSLSEDYYTAHYWGARRVIS